MRLAATIISLGLLAACTVDPPPEPTPTGPPDLALIWRHGEPLDPTLSAQALVFSRVWPVASDTTKTVTATETGTWPGFPARHSLTDVLRAIGYETHRAKSDADPRTGSTNGVPRFLWMDTQARPLTSLVEDLAQQPMWTHTLALAVDPDPSQPLLLLGGAVPELLRGATTSDPVSVLDILPTLLDAAGTVPPAGSPGRSLWAQIQGDPAPIPSFGFTVSENGDLSVRSIDWKLSWAGLDENGPAALQALAEEPVDSERFRLCATGSDLDVRARHPETVESLKAALVRWQLSAVQDLVGPTIDPALKATLQQRGYW